MINAGDGTHEHPTQALLDLLTIRRVKGRIEGLKVVICGDIAHSRVARSTTMALHLMGARVHLCGPRTLIPPGTDTWGAESAGTDFDRALPGADVVMMLRLQLERMNGSLLPSQREYFRYFGLDGRPAGLAKADAHRDAPRPDEPRRRDRKLHRRRRALGYHAAGRDGRCGARSGAAPPGRSARMSLQIINARLLDPATGTDAPGGVFIDKGVIKEFRTGTGVSFKDAKETIDADGLCLAPGLIDLRAKTGEPGEEHKETLATASRAALSGGITSLVVMPDTRPVIDDVALVQFIAERGRETAFARVYPAGGLTVGLAGEAMSEIGLMTEAGAVLFTNGDWPVASAQVMKRAMTYAASRGAIVMSRPDDRTLSGSGVMNGGEFAARNGLSGIPIEAEWLGAMRDVTLAEQTGCALILDQVTSQRTLDIVDIARGRGAKVFTTVAAHSLFFNELDVGDYLTYCKVNPPFRTEQARKTLIACAEGRLHRCSRLRARSSAPGGKAPALRGGVLRRGGPRNRAALPADAGGRRRADAARSPRAGHHRPGLDPRPAARPHRQGRPRRPHPVRPRQTLAL